MIIAAIVVTDLNNAIGKDNKLLCHLPADLKFFKATTMGCPVIMGRKTFESIGRALPGRKNIIITRNTNFSFAGGEVYNSIVDAIKNLNEERVFIIGGAEIYKQTQHLTKEIYRTLVKEKIDADTYYPEINLKEFELVWEEAHQHDEKNPHDYTFQKFVRR